MTGARVLIVDDDPAQIQMLKMFLVQQGYEIYTSLDGSEAVSLAAQIHPEIVLLDDC